MRIAIVTIDISSTTVGYMSADLSLLLASSVALDVAGELLQRDVESTGQLGGADDAEVVGRQDRRVLGERVGERHALAEVFVDRAAGSSGTACSSFPRR